MPEKDFLRDDYLENPGKYGLEARIRCANVFSTQI